MGSIRKDDKKINLTFRIRRSLVFRLKTIKNYNVLVEKLLDEYFASVDSADSCNDSNFHNVEE